MAAARVNLERKLLLLMISGGATQTFLYAAPYANAIAMEFSADPGATHTVDYLVFTQI